TAVRPRCSSTADRIEEQKAAWSLFRLLPDAPVLRLLNGSAGPRGSRTAQAPVRAGGPATVCPGHCRAVGAGVACVYDAPRAAWALSSIARHQALPADSASSS